jgi:hypothetical protein
VRPPRSTTTTIAILGDDTLVKDILTRLLEREGYNTRSLEASPPIDCMVKLLEGVDVLLVAPASKPACTRASWRP